MPDATQPPRLEEPVREALAQGGVIDITTSGRRSGEPRRLEIVFHNFDGRIYISGTPRPQPRSWLLNLEANPELTLHLKRGPQADLPARARVITEESERRSVLARVAEVW